MRRFAGFVGKRKMFVGALFLVVVLLVSCGRNGDDKKPIVPAVPPVVQTRDLALSPTVSISEIGTVKAVQEIEIMARAAGTVDSLSIALGEKVEATQPLGFIDSSSASNTAKVNLNTAENQLANAQQNYNEVLANNQDVVLRAKLRVDGLQSTLEKLERNLVELKDTNKSTLRTLELQLENAKKNADSAEVGYQSVTAQYEQSWTDFYKSAGLSLEGVYIAMNAYEQAITAIINPNYHQTAVLNSFNPYLGARDSIQRNTTVNLYNNFRANLKQEKTFYNESLPVSQKNVENLLSQASILSTEASALLNQMRTLLDNSIEGGEITATLLSTHKASIIAAQTGVIKDISTLDALVAQQKTLVRNQDTQLVTAQNNADIAENQLIDANNALTKFKVSGAASEKDLALQIDQAERDLVLAQADYQGAIRTQDIQNGTKNLELSTLKNQVTLAEKSFSDTTITSPIAGVISQVFVDEGDFVNPGTLIAKVIQSSAVKVVFYLPEETANRLNVGMPVSVITPSAEIKGAIEKIAPAVDPLSRKVQVEAVVTNENFLLKPDTFVNVRLDVSDAVFDEVKLYIPLNSILVGQNEQYVYVLEEGTVRQRSVEIGAVIDRWVEIKSGLSKTDTLISAGQRNVEDGERVTVKNEI